MVSQAPFPEHSTQSFEPALVPQVGIYLKKLLDSLH